MLDSMEDSPLKIAYITPSLYVAGGLERVLTLKANYFAEQYGYDITIILTDGKDKPFAYPLSEKIKVVNLDINFEELWTYSFLKKIPVYLKKQRRYKRALAEELMRLRPDITISLLRREINFLNDIKDGSHKIGEIHINRANYRNFKTEDAGIVKRLFAKFWSHSLLGHLKRLDRLVVLTEKDREAWTELDNVVAIPDPLPFVPQSVSPLTEKRVVAMARYSPEKGIDLLLQAWAEAAPQCPDWRLDVYGFGDRTQYEQQLDELQINRGRCELHGRTSDVERVYHDSSLFALSSRFEGFGMVIIEAMASGLPVVAFDCPWGPRSIINDGVDGLLAENDNPSALARQLVAMMGDSSRRQAMAQAAVVSVQRYQVDRIAAQWQNVFSEVMKNR